MNKKRLQLLKIIKNNIKQFDYHTYFITSRNIPRFVYTIGLTDKIKSELIIAGAIYYQADDIKQIIETIYLDLKAGKNVNSTFFVDKLGSFKLKIMHKSWSDLILGALDFYNTNVLQVYQIVPDKTHWTVDIPDLGKVWSPTEEPVWQWLYNEWTYSVPSNSTAITNLDALYGAKITEVTRWEKNEWEMFAGPGPDVNFEDSRIVPLATLLAVDPSLHPILKLKIKEGLWRDDNENSEWNIW